MVEFRGFLRWWEEVDTMGPVEGFGGVGDKDIEETSAQPADQIQATSPSPGFRKRSPKEMGKGVLTMVTATKRW